jgi:hypothetical protein
MIVVIALLLVGSLIAVAAVTESLATSSLTGRDMRVRRAQQAAEAGIQTQLYQQGEANLGSTSYNLNGGVLGLGTLLDCVVPQVNLGLVTGLVNVQASSAGACPQAVNSGGTSTSYTAPLGNHAYEQSETFMNPTTLFSGAEREFVPTVVSLGWDDNGADNGLSTGTRYVYSREMATLAPIAPLQAIEGMNNVTISPLSLATVLNGDVSARHNITTPPLALAGLDLSNGLLATLAYGNALSGGIAIGNLQHVTPSQIPLRPSVNIAPSKPDCSVAANCTALGAAYSNNTAGNTADTFSISSGNVTFQPGDYVFCNFSATGSSTISVNPSPSTPVRIYIDSPTSNRCKNNGYTETAGVWSGGNFNDTVGFSNGLLGTQGVLAASGMQVYDVGDGTVPYDGATTVQIGPSTTGLLSLSAVTYGAVVYAPTSTVTVNVPALCVLVCLGGVFDGSIVGYNANVAALTITQDLNIGNYPIYGGVNAFRPQQYVECSSVTSLTGTEATDTSGC